MRWGVAAHWKYKEGKAADFVDSERFAWLHQLVDWQKDVRSSGEFIDRVKVDVFSDEVLVFTPKGDVINLPVGSTPVDFAYHIHTDIGNNLVGAKVNDRIVPIDTQLVTGDRVQIITSRNSGGPKSDWLKFVKTSKAVTRIRHWIKAEERERSLSMGREVCEREFRKKGLNFSRYLNSPELLEAATKSFLQDRGGSARKHRVPKDFPHPDHRQASLSSQEEVKEKDTEFIAQERRKTSAPGGGVRVQGVDDLLVRMAKCCNPVPGDEIIGFITRGKGVTIHTSDCQLALETDPERRIDVTWNKVMTAALPVKIRVICHDVKGVLAGITTAITNCEANISSAHVQSTIDKRGENTFEVNVVDLAHLQKVMNAVMKVKGVIKVERIKQ